MTPLLLHYLIPLIPLVNLGITFIIAAAGSVGGCRPSARRTAEAS
jgi:hypothetical protein